MRLKSSFHYSVIYRSGILGISFIRTLILYIVISFALRLMGKRQIGEFQPAELVITILISELAALPMQDVSIPLAAGIIPIFTLVSAEIVISVLCLKSIKFRRFLNGNPCIVIKNGKIDEKKLFELRISIDELLEELRLNSITSIKEIKYAIIETNGQISFIPYTSNRPLTPNDMNISVDESSIPLIIVSDGKILYENLTKLKKDKKWFYKILDLNDIKKENEIFLMTVDEFDNIFLQKKEKNS